MGRPFNSELEKLNDTFHWAINLCVKDIKNEILSHDKKPLFIVGSGGSLSVCHYIAFLYQRHGLMAKAVTPLELFYSKEALKNSNILFISASGKNTDILFSYETALNYEPSRLFSLCMKKNSPLEKLANTISNSSHFSYDLPSGKDGFLATNSLIAFFTIFYKVFSEFESLNEFLGLNQDNIEIDNFMSQITPDFTFTILHAGLGQPVAIDIESKLAEAALGNILISDYRNFGHGRHHWFDKRKKNAAIIALVTPEENNIARKTLSLLPTDIPILILNSDLTNGLAAIDLLMKSFLFINKLGQLQNIDPGKPGVPDFGSKLYHLNYKRFYKSLSNDVSINKKLAIVRKSNSPTYDNLSDEDRTYWSTSYDNFVGGLSSVAYGALVFDYDGTICSSEDRYNGVNHIVATYLIGFLKHGIIIGIATGRGKSVREKLQNIIPEEYWDQVIIGYYNCSDFGLLKEDHLPDLTIVKNAKLQKIYDDLLIQNFIVPLRAEIRPHQIIIEIENKDEWSKVRLSIIQYITSMNISGIQILESSHSMDIIDQTQTNKLNIIEHCNKLTAKKGLSENCLCIGDKGRWPGNDYQLLSSQYSLSVDEVSSLNNTCWNLSKPCIKNVDATIYYLSCLNYSEKGLMINLK